MNIALLFILYKRHAKTPIKLKLRRGINNKNQVSFLSFKASRKDESVG